jgi:hypothetical protein
MSLARPARFTRSFAIALALLSAAAVVGSVTFATRPAYALDRGKDGFFQTGVGTRSKMGGKIYDIFHSIKELPDTKSKQALIDAPTDKRFTMVFREVPLLLKPIVGGSAWPKDKIIGSFREGFAANGFTNKEKIDKFVGTVTQDLAAKDTIFIQYNAASKTTTITAKGAKASIEGEDFMKAVWSLWFGKIDQKDLSDALIAKWLKSP